MVICVAKRTPTEGYIRHICDFSRGVLNTRLRAPIQHLLRGHKYALCIVLWADFGCGTKLLFKVEVIWKFNQMSFAYSETVSAIEYL